MKLSKMINNLQKVLKEHGDLYCFYSVDEEGSAHEDVFYEPTIFYQNKTDSDEILSKQDFKYDKTLRKKDYNKIVVIN